MSDDNVIALAKTTLLAYDYQLAKTSKFTQEFLQIVSELK
jgi:hypothetical protein